MIVEDTQGAVLVNVDINMSHLWSTFPNISNIHDVLNVVSGAFQNKIVRELF